MSSINLTPADVLELQRRAQERGQIAASKDNLPGQHHYIDSTMQDWQRLAEPRPCRKCRAEFIPRTPPERSCEQCRSKKTASKVSTQGYAERTYTFPHANGPVLGAAVPSPEDCPERADYVEQIWAELKRKAAERRVG